MTTPAAQTQDLQPEELRRLAPAAVELVREWLRESKQVPPDPASLQLASALRDPDGLAFIVGFVDGVIRPEDPRVAARNLRRLAKRIPSFLPPLLARAVQLGGLTAPLVPQVVVPAARRALRQLVGHLLIDASDARLGAAIRRLRETGVDLNLNLLGEAVLGEREAQKRLDGTAALLRRDDVDYVSLKVSAINAPHQPWGFEAAVAEAVERLVPLYRIAATAKQPKFINLDMEEYRDLALTVEVFKRVLEREEFRLLSAGIVLQAYLPDSFAALIDLQEWAAARVAEGGAPIKVRVVKGANLPMEHVTAELRNWPLATFDTKRETDTNYLEMLNWALHPERTRNIRIGVAGHNLFDLALAWKIAEARGVTGDIDVEMLLGMAPAQAEVVRRHTGGLRLYTPIVHPEEFDVAIAYLVRRLEEGASSENFMSAVFDLAASDSFFARERDRFLASIDGVSGEVPPPKRMQDRRFVTGPGERFDTSLRDYSPGESRALSSPEGVSKRTETFRNTPDSDPALPQNQLWAAAIRERAAHSALGRATLESHTVVTSGELERRIQTAVESSWSELTGEERAAVLHRAGEALEQRRGELLEIAAHECGKTFDQSDPEVSEAIDFAHFYAERARELDHVDGAEWETAGPIAVIPPWNFPIAIPAGGMLAALAAGSPVIVKPAAVAARTGAVVAEALWEAGVPNDALQFVQFDDRELASALVKHDAIARVILTGGYETAEAFLEMRPELDLRAETSGKNAIIVTPSADYDLAVADVIHSAFGHAGQKCSAASLVILVGQSGKSRRLRNQLVDAAKSLRVGLPTDPAATMGPLTAPVGEKLRRGLTELGPGENWVLRPRQLDADARVWSPGIRAGVERGGEFHRVEYFGPVLGVMRVDTLEEAIEIVNDVDYGLTSGLHSLDRSEIATWLDGVQAGNLYVNRGTTGAIVARQPFGGWKKSTVGATVKAGGAHYVASLANWRLGHAKAGAMPLEPRIRQLLHAAEELQMTNRERLVRATRSDELAWQQVFGAARDAQGLVAERNVVRYFPAAVTIRLAEGEVPTRLLRVVAAGLRADAPLTISSGEQLPARAQQLLTDLGIPVRIETDAHFRRSVTRLSGRLRFIGGEDERREIARAATGCVLAIWHGPVTESGWLELLPFVREQAVSITGHRFGTPSTLTDGLLVDAPSRNNPAHPVP
ncbi:proline dehydrogenase family protein [Gulosibacter molinativorax]|uniref:L-glutamate gamma-semialdehyde dehydrogenase n=1 Tax=Gulosibacter molinativorax TaxID=256821 RepID=A0ABT7CA14_9MICO|nr:bifunctional proline dehydrogenase/L-glutamate gamma-semialdehyde dehydrogenase [Gulosibacter molinativorax]MDJ1371989.1 1-pyrroline-5-carboxylate dehydrogenase [Gulosibacter molinativorax]QUY62646.1 Proline dehydrogenase/delta-1-pyrroline-5-carboxylate dehydrogenase [Gulosibacter molinativorax]